MDAKVLLAQIGRGNLMACGARDFIQDKKNNSLTFRVGSGRKLAKIVVTLDPDDTYSVRYVEMKRKTYETVVDEKREGIYCDNIGEVVREMGDR